MNPLAWSDCYQECMNPLEVVKFKVLFVENANWHANDSKIQFEQYSAACDPLPTVVQYTLGITIENIGTGFLHVCI